MESAFYLRIFSTPGLYDSEADARSTSAQPLLSPGKPLALLCFLWVEDRPVHREELAELFWPDVDLAHGKGSLRQALWSLRRVVGEEGLEANDAVALNAELVEADLGGFRAALDQGELDRAAGLWTGSLLEGMEFPATREWDRWVEALRTREEHRFGSALMMAGESAREAANISDARRWLQTAARVQPYRPATQRALVETLLEARDYQGAEDALATARQALADRGSEVGSEFSDLEERLKALRLDLSAGGEAHSLRTEFVGRTAEFSGLAAAWRRAKRRGMEVSLVMGAPGIGKTRLVQELLALVRSEDCPGLVVKAVEAERDLRWGTASEIVRALYSLPGAAGIGNRSASVLARLVPSLGAFDQKGAASGHVEAAAVTDALLDLVSAVTHEGPLLLFVDDSQWIDKESRASLSYLARNLTSEAVLLVIACRTGERDPEVAKALDGLTRLEGTRRFELSPLGSQDVAELLAVLLEGVEPEEVDGLGSRLHGITQGNPLFIVEILKLLHAQELLEPTSRGRWTLDASCIEGPLPVPQTVESAILKRLEDLGSSAELLAIQLARHARPVVPEDLRRQTALDPFQVSEGIRELFEKDLARRDSQSRIVFAHDAVTAVARAHLHSSAWARKAQESDARGRRRRPWWPWASVAAALVAVVLAGLGGMGPMRFLAEGPGAAGSGAVEGDQGAMEQAYPYGRGRIFIPDLRGARANWITPPRTRTGEWAIKDTILNPGHPGSILVHRLPSDSLIWFVPASESPGDPPYVGILQADGRVAPFWRGTGDVGVRDLSPDGRSVLITQERTTAPWYAHDLLAVDRATGRARVLLEAPERNADASWSPDGLKIAAVLRAQQDSIYVLDTRGRPHAVYSIPATPTLARLDWCGDSRTLAFSSSDRGTLTLGLLDVQTGGHEILASGSGLTRDVVCLGDGAALAYPEAEDGRPVLKVIDLDSRSQKEIPLSLDGARLATLIWVPDHVQPVAQELNVEPGEPSVRWGRQVGLSATGTFSDGTLQQLEVEWEALDPNRASVDPEGVVTGNQAGPGLIVAHYGPWLEDTVTVLVQEWERPDVALSADFQAEDLSQWEPFGEPPSRIVEVDGELVLSLEGDGRYEDGVRSRESFTLDGGARVEVVFRLDLTRSDRQRLSLCVQPDSVAGPMEEGAFLGSIRDRAYCLRYPALEQLKFDPLDLSISYYATGSRDFVRLPERFDSSEWTQFALEIQSDGQVGLYVNQELVRTLPGPLLMSPGDRWKILLTGASVDTELYVRSVTVYSGTS